jgi:hypothetical protein
VTVDNLAPVVAISAPTVTTTVNGPVSFVVTMTDANPGTFTLTAAQVALVKSGNAKLNATVTVTPTANPNQFQVTLSNVTGGKGKLGIRLPAGVATDLAGNSSAGPVSSALVTITGTRILKVANLNAPSLVSPNGSHTFTLSYANTGTQTAKSVVLEVMLPEFGTLDVAGSDARWQQVAGRRYRITIGDLSVGATGTALLKVNFGNPGVLAKAVSLISVLKDDQSNNTAIASATSNFTIGLPTVPTTRVRW